MVIAGVLDTEASSVAYAEMGCKDSKLLTPKKREELAPMVRARAKEVVSVEISAQDIDSMRKVMSLNEVEAKYVADLINSLEHKPDKIIIDCPDTEPQRFIERLRKYLGPDFNAIAEHKADVNYPIVSAASIIAKVQRDEWVKKTQAKYGDIGSGYPADPITKKFLEDYFKQNGKVPPFSRKSWETAKQIENRRLQQTLSTD